MQKTPLGYPKRCFWYIIFDIIRKRGTNALTSDGVPEKPLAFWGEGRAREWTDVFAVRRKRSQTHFALTWWRRGESCHTSMSACLSTQRRSLSVPDFAPLAKKQSTGLFFYTRVPTEFDSLSFIKKEHLTMLIFWWKRDVTEEFLAVSYMALLANPLAISLLVRLYKAHFCKNTPFP